MFVQFEGSPNSNVRLLNLGTKLFFSRALHMPLLDRTNIQRAAPKCSTANSVRVEVAELLRLESAMLVSPEMLYNLEIESASDAVYIVNGSLYVD